MGKINLTVGEVQGHLRQMSTKYELTPEERYSLMAAIESMDIIRQLAPGISKAMKKLKEKK